MVVQSLVPETDSFADTIAMNFGPWIEQLLQQSAQSYQRRLLSCEGNLQWCDHLYEKYLRDTSKHVLLSDRCVFDEAIPVSKVETLLGSETELVVVDLFGGLNPDVICIAAGLVKCGGLLVLLSSGPDRWLEIQDQYGTWQNRRVSPGFEFVHYFFESMNRDRGACIRIQQQGVLVETQALPVLKPTRFVNGRSKEQVHVLDQISRWLTDTTKTFALLTADRGRGKSACLGFAITEMVENLGYSVLLTAYSRRSADIVFAHSASASFVAPDRLIANQMSADILVIDEAAMLPCSMLAQLCGRFKKVLMATTVGGYEGTGQGFLLRFVARLDQNRLLELALRKPVRWAEHDCLENWINRTFVMSNTLTGSVEASAILSDLRFDTVNGRGDIELIKNIYRLMTSAHYRTRPSDLRALMENPDLVLMVAKDQSHIMGMLAANAEGGFEQQLSEQVFLGRRRPKGHLLAQMLTAQAGLRNFACYSGLRIQRIAVEANNRRKGIGRRLIDHCEANARKRRLDYIGACFALDSDSAAFWSGCGFRLVHISFGQGKSTGNQTVVVIKTINADLQLAITQLQNRLFRGLPVMMVQSLQQMIATDVIAMLRLLQYESDLQQLELDEVEAFILGNKGFDLCFPSLQRFVMHRISESPAGQHFHPWLIEKVVQNRDYNELTPREGRDGKKSIIKILRRLVGELVA